MTLYKGQCPFEVELMHDEKRETLFTESIRRQSYRAMNNNRIEPGLLTDLKNMANDGSIQAEKIIEVFTSKGLLNEEFSEEVSSLRTLNYRRGDAGPGFKGILSLGPYVNLPNQQNLDEVSNIDRTINELADRGIDDPYGAIEQE